MKKIQIVLRRNYGHKRIYPHCDRAELFMKIAGTKSLSKRILSLIVGLGYTLELMYNGDVVNTVDSTSLDLLPE